MGAATCTKIARKKGTQHQRQHAATSSWLKERQHIPPTTEAADMPKKKYRREKPREHRKTTGRVFSSKLVKTNLSFASAVRGRTDPKTSLETATSSRVPERPKSTPQEPG
jgi:hypothetical protein